eukprot:116894-Prorocentrum_minimum.AAC.2
MARDGLLPAFFHKHDAKGVLTWNLLATGAVLTSAQPPTPPRRTGSENLTVRSLTVGHTGVSRLLARDTPRVPDPPTPAHGAKLLGFLEIAVAGNHPH